MQIALSVYVFIYIFDKTANVTCDVQNMKFKKFVIYL